MYGWWLFNITTPEVRSWAPVVFLTYIQLKHHTRIPHASNAVISAGRSNIHTVMEIKAARIRNELPYVDFQPHHALGNAFDAIHNYVLRFGRHMLKPWLVWYLAQWMGAVCSTESDHISDCGSVSWFDKECYRIGTSWRDNVKHFCRVGTSDLSFTLPPGQSTTSMDDVHFTTTGILYLGPYTFGRRRSR